jgi:hypothetical protein
MELIRRENLSLDRLSLLEALIFLG